MHQKSRSYLYTFTAALAAILLLAPAGLAQTKSNITGLVAMGEINGLDGVPNGGNYPNMGAYWTPDNGLEEANGHTGIYNAVDINVTWEQLQPTDSTHYDYTAIDDALANVTTYNTNNPSHPMVAKLRVYAGVNSPSWVLTMTDQGGYTGPVEVIDDATNPILIPLFWSTSYHAAWKALQAKLAARYDGNALIGEVAITSCSQLSAEPFKLPIHDTTSLTNLQADGYSDSAMETCLNNAVSSNVNKGDYTSWTKTPLYLPVNIFYDSDGYASDPNNEPLDATYANGVMDTFRTNFGSRAIIGNNGLQYPLYPKTQAPIYSNIATEGSPVNFQTITPNPPDTNDPSNPWLDLVENMAVPNYGATEMEVWQTTGSLTNTDGTKGSADITTATLTTLQGLSW